MAKSKFTTGELNLMKEFGLDVTKVDEPRDQTLYNRFSGAPAEVNLFEAKIYTAAMTLYQAYEHGEKINVSKADRLKYLLLKLNMPAYQELLD